MNEAQQAGAEFFEASVSAEGCKKVVRRAAGTGERPIIRSRTLCVLEEAARAKYSDE